MLGTILLMYIVLRAYYLSFTHDESLTFSIINGDPSWADTPNNHYFNTILSGFSNTLFDSSEIALRLPNIIAFILYFGGFYYIIKPTNNFYIYLLGFVVLVLNPFFIDFFSVCRGYGLSSGFMMISLFFFLYQPIKFFNEKIFLRNFILSLFFAALGIYANLALSNFYIALMLIFVLIYLFNLWKNKTSSIKLKFCVVFVLSFLPIILATKRLFVLDNLHQLYFGEETFFNAIGSLVCASIYRTQYPSWFLLSLIYIFLITIPLGLLSVIIKKDFHSKFALITYMLVFVSVGLILEHVLFSAKYPCERTALFFIPMYGLFIIYFTIHILSFYSISKKIYKPILISLCVPLIIHFITSINLKYTKTWDYDANTKDAMSIINDKTKNLSVNSTISNNWLFEPAINYYIISRKMKLNATNRDGINSSSDFIYRRNDDTVSNQYKVISNYTDTNTSLLVKK